MTEVNFGTEGEWSDRERSEGDFTILGMFSLPNMSNDYIALTL